MTLCRDVSLSSRPFHALEMEAEIRVGPRLGQDRFLGLAGSSHLLVLHEREGRDQSRHHHEDHGRDAADEHRRRHGYQSRGSTHEERDPAVPLGPGLSLLEDLVLLFDPGRDLGVLGRGPGRFGGPVELGLCFLDIACEVPQGDAIDRRQVPDQLVVMSAGREIGRGQPQLALGAADVEPGRLEQVDLAVDVGEAGADVDGRVDVDHPMAGAVGSEDGEPGAHVGDDLGVNTVTAGTQRADELADETFAFEAPDARDHGQPFVEVEVEGVVTGLDHKSLESHAKGIGA